MRILSLFTLSIFLFANGTHSKITNPSAFFPRNLTSSLTTFKTAGPVTKNDYLKMQEDFKKITNRNNQT